MLQEFWRYFMVTGQVDAYLNYKAYEAASMADSSTPAQGPAIT